MGDSLWYKIVCVAGILALPPLAPALAQGLSWAPPGAVETGEIPALSPISGDLDYGAGLEGAIATLERFAPVDHDLATRAQTLETLEAVFAFVRDEVRPAPYEGDLRGPEATFAARAGNDEDQAELLVEMLLEIGVEARKVSARIETPTALQLPGCVAPSGDDPLVLGQIDGPAKARMHARAVRDYGLLAAALPPIDAVATMPDAGAPHTWVQARRDGNWIDLDPMLIDAEVGASLARGTPAPAPAAHMVALTVQAETLSGGALGLAPVLSVSLPASELAEAKVQLGFTSELSGTGGGIAGAFAKALDQAPRIRPLLLIDDETIQGDTFDTPAPPAKGAGLGSASADPVTAIWLELTTTRPDGAKTTARRTLVDLLPPELRVSGKVTPDAIMAPDEGEKLPVGLEALHTIIVSHGGLDPFSAAAMRALMVLDLPEVEAGTEAGTTDQTQMLWQIWADAYAKSVSAEALVKQNSGPMGCAMVTAPRVYLFTSGGTGPDDLMSVDWAIDGVKAVGAPDPGAAAEIRVWHGVVQSAYETALAESMLRIFGGAVGSTSTLLNGPLGLVEEPPKGGGWIARADADAGWLLVSGPQPEGATAVWWRVDPASGATDARMAPQGNVSRWKWKTGLSQVGHTTNGAWDAKTGKFIPNNKGQNPNLGGKSWREVNKGPMRKKLEKILADLKRRKAVARERKLRKYWDKRTGRGGGGNEYLVVLENISVPLAITVGTGVGVAVVGAYFYALTGEKP
ncbi:transglutaminase domain-containing protein [Oceanibium sediminis]|uniref:transglutaminase domain-containing protein n=1 Tax=Oceanibium sediminis TaxID=2026339 RepID=UPI000DD421DA|nr:transglutaminase domain-containing protein [Oceanibium sediminis]